MITYQRERDTGIVEVVIEGTITDRDVQDLTAKLERDAADSSRLLVLVVVGSIEGVEPTRFFADIERLIPENHAESKAAIVADANWKTWFAALVKPYIGTRIRHFAPTDLDPARQWLCGHGEGGEPLGGSPAR